MRQGSYHIPVESEFLIYRTYSNIRIALIHNLRKGVAKGWQPLIAIRSAGYLKEDSTLLQSEVPGS